MTAVEALIDFTRTELAGELPKVSRAVQAQGEVLITSHNKPEMVLMTVERYQRLQQLKPGPGDKLEEEFQALLLAMQTSESKAGVLRLMEASGEELGQAALAAEQERKARQALSR